MVGISYKIHLIKEGYKACIIAQLITVSVNIFECFIWRTPFFLDQGVFSSPCLSLFIIFWFILESLLNLGSVACFCGLR